MIVYFISGLGADERAFERLRLPADYQIRHIAWKPVNGDESIEDYARFLCREIDVTEPFMLAGLSFGGIVAVEMCKFIKPEKLILFSTISKSSELPALYKLAGRIKLYRFLPELFFSATRPLLFWYFGPLDKAGKKLLTLFLKKTDLRFLRWALAQISCWKNKGTSCPIIHIHGSKDRVFPMRLSKPDYVVKDGGHLCVFTHAVEVNGVLEKELLFH